jgi:hypothetical protein
MDSIIVIEIKKIMNLEKYAGKILIVKNINIVTIKLYMMIIQILNNLNARLKKTCN